MRQPNKEESLKKIKFSIISFLIYFNFLIIATTIFVFWFVLGLFFWNLGLGVW